MYCTLQCWLNTMSDISCKVMFFIIIYELFYIKNIIKKFCTLFFVSEFGISAFKFITYFEYFGNSYPLCIFDYIDIAMSKVFFGPSTSATFLISLVGSLLVGLNAAKSLAITYDKPFIGINHLSALLYQNCHRGVCS